MSKVRKGAKKKARTTKTKAKPASLRAVLAGAMRNRSETALETTGAAAPATSKTITFSCSNPNCLVGITSGPLNFAFSGSAAASFPVGDSPIFFRIQGPGTPVTLTTQGGTLTPAVAGTPAFGGFTTLTVT